ncbi:hypothetical protein BCR43DRAFT_500776 [Syncephalastrum racemosum]|uniref:Uncharacterized protein n=1 Tax=Syncephalastrum racemosum TaxID=13706 RepID=A0A1X2HTA8_SYNRA|nr:hypothetical protein BCR43DRAFT_500776 [Syncephalastrum racemosum]
MRYATPQLTPTHAVMQSPLHPQQHQTSQPPVMSRTQHKLMLQRQSFLADDKDYLEHPNNMRRLTKELDRVNREYRFVRHFEDPLAESFRRVASSSPPPNLYMNNNSYNTSSAEHPAYYRTSPSPPPRLNRRSSAQECLLAVKDQPEEHPKGFLSRLFNNNASSSTSTSSSSSSTASTHSCGYTNYPTGASSINCHPLAAPLQPPPPPFSNALATTSTTNPRRVT